MNAKQNGSLLCSLMFFTMACPQVAISQPSQQSLTAGTNVGRYAVVETGPHHRLWQKTIAITNFDGTVRYKTSSFKELASGLNHLVGGSWVQSSADIQVTPDGYGAATNTQHNAWFSPNLNTTSAIALDTPEGVRLQSTILGINLHDASTGSNVVIAQLQDSIGQILANTNQVIYTNALASWLCDFQADVLYSQTKGGFEQDVVVNQQPPSPSTFGLNPGTTFLQIWTEFYDSPDPAIITNTIQTLLDGTNSPAMVELADSTLKFGQMQIGRGKAYLKNPDIDSSVTGTRLIPIVKQWVKSNGHKYLLEQVPYDAITSQLSALPPSQMLTNGPGASAPRKSFFNEPVKNPSLQAIRKMKPDVRLASLTTKSRPALILDYAIVNESLRILHFAVTRPTSLSMSSPFQARPRLRAAQY